jgi:uncharacterized protein YijF (DUF1287 family)
MRKLPCLLVVLASFVLVVPALAGSEPSRLAKAARDQVGVTVTYDPSYTRLEFPGGDLPRDRGVCTDVVIRALRDGWGIDLQLAVNRDMTADFAAYPAFWGLTAPDRNIDHRRVPNLQRLFTRIGAEVPLSDGPTPYLPGDIITWTLPGNIAHMGIVSDQLGPDGSPLILHNIGAGAQEEDILFAYPMTGHYRIGADQAARLKSLTQ